MAAPRFKFSWSKRFGVPAQAFGEWLYELKARSAENIVEQARDPKCIAHGLFEWNDGAAARAYRIRQAQEIVASLEVEVITPKRRITRVRAFITSEDHSSYVVFSEANDDELNLAEQRALGEMIRMRQRWQTIRFARGVVDAIDAARVTASRMRRRRARR